MVHLGRENTIMMFSLPEALRCRLNKVGCSAKVSVWIDGAGAGAVLLCTGQTCFAPVWGRFGSDQPAAKACTRMVL